MATLPTLPRRGVAVAFFLVFACIPRTPADVFQTEKEIRAERGEPTVVDLWEGRVRDCRLSVYRLAPDTVHALLLREGRCEGLLVARSGRRLMPPEVADVLEQNRGDSAWRPIPVDEAVGGGQTGPAAAGWEELKVWARDDGKVGALSFTCPVSGQIQHVVLIGTHKAYDALARLLPQAQNPRPPVPQEQGTNTPAVVPHPVPSEKEP